ncbi:MAG: bifunctional oligoribonuclease/PAP phosphatase NrnA [Eubacteriales bacterium]|nr:bifunctional oligoribonuclease/PAP phosphatase NrnA [Eubacteriales bacterium]
MTNASDRYRIGELLTAIQNTDSIWLFPHISPDGDTIGSTLALKMLLERLKKPVIVLLDDVPPATLSFLPDIYCVRRYDEESTAPSLTENTLIISLDVSSADRLGRAQKLFERVQNSAQLDHHPTNPGFAHLNVIDGEAPASAILVYRLFEAFGLPIRREEAICLYTGLATDTGNFVYQNTNAEAFHMMEKLMEAGLPIAQYARRLFRCKEKEHIALLGKALPTMRYLCGGEIAGMHLSIKAFRAAGATAEHADGVVDYAIDASGVKMAYFARETETGEIKCSLRALTPYRVDGVAERFGGGGHQLAAGCTLPGPMRSAVRKLEAALQKEYHGGAQQ